MVSFIREVPSGSFPHSSPIATSKSCKCSSCGQKPSFRPILGVCCRTSSYQHQKKQKKKQELHFASIVFFFWGGGGGWTARLFRMLRRFAPLRSPQNSRLGLLRGASASKRKAKSRARPGAEELRTWASALFWGGGSFFWVCCLVCFLVFVLVCLFVCLFLFVYIYRY